MLELENSSESVEAVEAAPVKKRRRAASRPAGSAAPTEAPAESSATSADAVAPEAKADVTPRRRRAATKPASASTTRRRKVVVDVPATQTADEAPAAQEPAPEAAQPAAVAEKPARRRATRKAAAPSAEVAPVVAESTGEPAEPPVKATRRRGSKAAQASAPVEAPAVADEAPSGAAEAPAADPTPAEQPVPADQPAQQPTRRRRATRAAAAPAPVAAPEAVQAPRAAAAPAPVAAPEAAAVVAESEQVPAPVETRQDTTPQASQAPTRRRRATRATAAPAPVAAPVAETVAAPEAVKPELESRRAPQQAIDTVEDRDTAAREPEPRSRRRRASRGAAAPEPQPAAGEVDDLIGAALKAAEDLAEARRSVLADPFMTREAREAELAALAGAIALDASVDVEDGDDEEADEEEAEVAESAVEEADVEGDEKEDEESADDDRPARRRRRRGGRRRRRGGRDDEGDDEQGAEEGEPEEGDGEEPDAAEGASDEEPQQESDDSSSTTRRRRRRRRRGESDKESSSDDEVTGIEGSTRMEAKRQRRKESRAAGRRRAPILSEAEFLARRESVDRRLVIRQSAEYTQLAVIEDEILVEHYVDKASAASLIGNIYVGKVQNVLPSMEAAFIDIGRGRNAVLYAGEVDWSSFGVSGEHRKVENVLKSGQSVLVQVTKDPVGAKGARLTSHISLPGRYIVYSPGGHLSGISRKLPDNERHRLRDVLSGVISDEESVIVRTAAEGVAEDELVRDVNRLKAQWEVIEKKSKQGGAPQALYAEPDLTLRIVRDLFTEDFGHLIVQGNGGQDDAFDAISAYVSHVAPHLIDRVERYEAPDDGKDVFAKFRVDEQIAKALDRKVYLPSGGSLVIDRTEAMTVIDVNTGRFTGSAGNLEATVTSNNLEAAEEIVRQLRLRDLGGIIVIDFIDMVLPSNRDLLLRRLVECLGRDRTRHQVAEVTSLGLVQLTRKRIGTGLAEAFTEPCDHCHGAGYLRFDEPVESQAPADGGERKSGGRRKRK